ncbi:hypothetical protein JMN32_01805 [Fulvivirga sp. 29W222]|uniref:PLD phosphodiesterase domain-containing protein n=1 Tax=Fulvivirga marina TaxID=2494733 RepID=A0A937KAW0_9BACT|nr:phospholipase D-like domain-containing protein [Fulvivirga marina]MBL6445024.1 hypothetical protein [Fulvivirga marina]
MIGNNHYSIWGIKDSGEDITPEILDILNNANSFIIVGGYNFTFKTAGYTFFSILLAKVRQGVPVLMVIPPNLTGYHNNQPAIINFCLTNGIGLILNGNNHSKWLMTENDLYYGSSNFTDTSWRHRVEVITIHRHRYIFGSWKRRTLLDFRLFIQREINKVNRRPTMTAIPGLIANTIATWNSINPMILRLNPSIEKVISSLKNYNQVELLLNNIIENWFMVYNPDNFNIVYDLNFSILESISQLCDYAYQNIFNETIENKEISDEQIINSYNEYHRNFQVTMTNSIKKLEEIDSVFKQENNFQLFEKNIALINEVESRIKRSNNN